MKFLIDNQLPLTLARWLRGRNGDALHVLECEMGQADDLSVWNLAGEENRILITKDEDFFILATRAGENGKLLWLRMGNCRTSALLSFLNLRWDSIMAEFENNERIVELR